MRKNSRGKLSGAVRDETHAEVQQQEKEVSSRDKSAISPDTDAVPMRRWRTANTSVTPVRCCRVPAAALGLARANRAGLPR